MCKVSIIMPVYNKVNYIDKAIKSILEQTFSDWELIVIDDGSTDGSSEKCDLYQSDSRVNVIHIKNGGVSRARNIGIEHSKGEYLLFIDADDFVETTFIEHLYKPEYDLVIGGLTKLDLNGNVIDTIFPKLSGECRLQDVLEQFYKEQTESGIYGFVASKLVKAEIVKKNGIQFDERIKLAEDYDFYLKVYSHVNTFYFNQVSDYFYVKETDSSEVLLDETKIDFFIQIELQMKTKEFLKQYEAYGEDENRLYLDKVTGYLYTILLMNKCENLREFKKLLKRLKKLIHETKKDLHGFQKLCIGLYNRNQINMLYFVLKARNIVRK